MMVFVKKVNLLDSLVKGGLNEVRGLEKIDKLIS